MRGRAVVPFLAGVCLVCVGGCNVRVHNGGNGEKKDVKISTPAGAISVQTNQTSAEDLGLPAYPGARIDNTEDRDRPANVNMGFGHWQFHVQVVSYRSSDSQDKVAAFYRQALSSYGGVIECMGNKPMGSPATTPEGLSCADSGKARFRGGDFQLKAGSRLHQHIVAFKKGNGPASEAGSGVGSEFVLIALDLPRGPDGKQQQTN